MANDILAGYMGALSIGSSKVRVNSFDVNPEQQPLFYDHTIGLRDSIPTSIYETKGDTGFKSNPQKNIYRPGPVLISGSTSFPLVEGTESQLFNYAKTADNFEMTYTRDCKNAVKYKDCKISSYQLSATAGDIVNVTASIVSTRATESGSGLGLDSDVKKIITWDKCDVSLASSSLDIVSLNFNIENECKPIYTAGYNAGLYENSVVMHPFKIRVGFQTVNGSIGFYNKGVDLKYIGSSHAEDTLSVNIGGLSFSASVILSPVKREGQIGPIVSTLQFTGCGNYWG